jgi:hypothetical protein
MQACDIFLIVSEPGQETNAMPLVAVSLSLATNWTLTKSKEEPIPSMASVNHD